MLSFLAQTIKGKILSSIMGFDDKEENEFTILLENGSGSILQEDGFYILQEDNGSI